MKQSQGLIPPLRHDWRLFAYTDGSFIKDAPEGAPGIGAAVHVPAHLETERPEDTIHINCLQKSASTDLAYVNTIGRAELAAIHVALEHVGSTVQQQDGTINIATDSLSSIYGIRKALTRPQDIQEHRHLKLLEAIDKAIEDAPGQVHLWKVKSHTGIVGNDAADEGAVAVASGRMVDPDDLHDYQTPSNHREDKVWPHTTAEQTRTTKTGETTTTTTTTICIPVSNLEAALKDIVHPLKKLGQARQDGIYFTSWKNILSDVAHKHSHSFITSSKVKRWVKKITIGYRWGVLTTAKRLHMYGIVPSPACPLCGHDDGGHHALSACPMLSAAVTRRHNDAGTEIVEAICNGTRGGAVLLSDVGIRRRRSVEDLPATLQFCRYLANAEYPATMPQELQAQLRTYKGSIPDALLYEDNSAYGRYYGIVEIKYCRDTNPEHQEQRAAAQHQQLKTIIEENDPSAKVYISTLMLGVSGVIYQSFLDDMETKLGVSGQELDSLAKRLHFIAINNIGKIWKQRAAMITERDKCKRANWSRAKKRASQAREPDHRKKQRLR
jgi:ribonuclease HI